MFSCTPSFTGAPATPWSLVLRLDRRDSAPARFSETAFDFGVTVLGEPSDAAGIFEEP